MLSAYLDESGTHLDGSPIVVVAGLVAPPRQWERLTAEWQKILDSEGLADFHMKDCAHLKNEFAPEKGWTRERTGKLMRRLIPLIRRRVHYRTWTALVMSDYRSMVPRDVEEKLPYGLAALGCCSRLRMLGIEKDILIPCVFDQGGHENELVFRAFRDVARRGQSSYYRIGMLSQGKRSKCPPLQAADLHAYEVRKYFADQANRTGRRLRTSLKELMPIPEAGGGGYLMIGEKIRLLLGTIYVRGKDYAGDEPIPIPIDHLNLQRQVRLIPGPPAKWDLS